MTRMTPAPACQNWRLWCRPAMRRTRWNDSKAICRREVAQLRQLDLQFALVAAGTLSKDIQDQPGAIEHPAFQVTLEVALLARA